MRTIPLTRGYEAIVSDRWFGWLTAFKWRALVTRDGQVYAVRSAPRPRTKGQTILMHRVILARILGREPEQVDHRSGDGLDNRDENLREATNAQNQQNSRSRRGSTSAFKGVFWNSRVGRWQARLHDAGRQVHLGFYDDEVAASLAYDVAVRERWPEFGRTNT